MVAGILSVVALSPRAPGQVAIGPQVRVDNGNPNSGVETAVGFVRLPGLELEAMAVSIDWRLGVDSVTGFGITFDGGLNWEEGLTVVPNQPTWAAQNGLDGMVWPDPVTGNLWLAANAGESGNILNYVAALARTPGAHAAQMPGLTLLTEANRNTHLPKMAAGPAPAPAPGDQRNFYISYAQQLDDQVIQCYPLPLPCGAKHMMILRSTDAGATWVIRQVRPPLHPCVGTLRCEYQGFSNGFVVADREPRTGLICMIDPGVHALWSLDAGDTWNAYEDRVQFFDPQLLPNTDNSDIPGKSRIPIIAHMALDETTGEFYIVMSAKRAVGSENLDLYLIRGRTRTGTPPIEFDPPVRLDLDQAEWAYNPDQVVPSIAIDGMGGINLLYYDTRNNVVPDSSNYAFLDAYYARITGFGTPQQDLRTYRLTGQSFCTTCSNPCSAQDDCPYELGGDLEQFVGDYNRLDASGCDVYLSYMAIDMPDPQRPGKRHMYVRRVDLCPPDADSDMMVNAADVSAFQAFITAGDPRADFNRDGTVSVADYSAFSAAYSAWGPP
ncbi:MAG: hypothetical protein IT437_07060 [Phycisphaerales bacterium]|nr:hypothetical protein [Phycisphaerales bacterium]